MRSWFTPVGSREAITDPEFRGGTGNPSEFCKSENGWKKIQKIQLELEGLSSTDLLTLEEQKEAEQERTEVNRLSQEISVMEAIMSKSEAYWRALTAYNEKSYNSGEIQVALPLKCIQMLRGGRVLSDRQMSALVKIDKDAQERGFEFHES